MGKPQENNTNWKNAVIVLGGVLLLWLIFSQISSTPGTYREYLPGTAATGVAIGGLLFGLINLTIKILWILVLVGVLAGLYEWGKQYLAEFNTIDFSLLVDKIKGNQLVCPKCGEHLTEEFRFCPRCKESLKKDCFQCGKELLAGWEYCPSCGQAIENNKEGGKNNEQVV